MTSVCWLWATGAALLYGKGKKKSRDDKAKKRPPERTGRGGGKAAGPVKRSKPALPRRRRRSPSIRGVSVPLGEDPSPVSPPAAPPRLRLRARVAVPHGTVAQAVASAAMSNIRRRPAAAEPPPIWFRRKRRDASYPESGGTWKLLDLKWEAGIVHELWQWEED